MTSSNSAGGDAGLAVKPVEARSIDIQPLPVEPLNVRVETKVGAFAFPCVPGHTLLEAGVAAGFALPYECATGTCGSCHARVIEGTVDPGWLQAPGYSRLKPDVGDVLMCQAVPSTSCMLRVRTRADQSTTPQTIVTRRRGHVVTVERLTADVVHFELDLDMPMDFAAGQFVTLGAPGLSGRRAYSMVNFGNGLERLGFVVKRKPGGGFSDWLFDGDPRGGRLEVVGPFGRATFRPMEKRNLVCIAGGSGIAGMMAMLEHANHLRYFDTHRGAVFFGVRTLEDAFYLERFAGHIAQANTNLNVVIALSHADVAGHERPAFPGIRIATGFVHEVASATMHGRWDNTVGFVAGPEPMVNAALKMLIAEAGLPAEFIRYDKFS